jgi:hypothetical protein
MPFAEPAKLLVPHGGLQREGVQQQDHVGVRQPGVQMVDAGVLDITSAIGPPVLCGVGDGYHAARRSCLAAQRSPRASLSSRAGGRG